MRESDLQIEWISSQLRQLRFDLPPRKWSLAPSGFEPLSPAPKASMLGRYTTGLPVVTGRSY